LTAAIVATALTTWTRGQAGKNFLAATAALTFDALTVIAAAGGDRLREWLADYSSAMVLFLLATVMLLSTAAVPFTERYARQGLPKDYWGSPQLRAINRRITLVWTGCTVAAALSVTAAEIIFAHMSGTTDQSFTYVLTWLIPILLVLGAYRYTDTVTAPEGRTSAMAASRSGGHAT
jgi:hypothetical protein